MTQIRKDLWIVRHGQAMHNPRAEAAKEAGCSHEEFLAKMRDDDFFDAPLTDMGIAQAQAVSLQRQWANDIDLIVSSPLSRALATADTILPPSTSSLTTRTATGKAPHRLCIENLREINGWLLNAQRRPRDALEDLFPAWDFTEIAEADELWTTELESEESCAHRAYLSLCHILHSRPEQRILWVGHGGLLRFLMNKHARVRLLDSRQRRGEREHVGARFGNAEVRRYTLEDKGANTLVLTEVDWIQSVEDETL